MKRLKNATWETICDAFEVAVADEDKTILEQIDRQVEEYEAQPSYTYRAYEKEYEHIYIHGVREWLWMIQDGAATLPDRLPRSVLMAWRDRYRADFGDGKPWSPMPFWKCQDCAMILPYGDGGWGGLCPVCGSTRIWHADLSKRLGVNWIDPHAVHRSGEN